MSESLISEMQDKFDGIADGGTVVVTYSVSDSEAIKAFNEFNANTILCCDGGRGFIKPSDKKIILSRKLKNKPAPAPAPAPEPTPEPAPEEEEVSAKPWKAWKTDK